VAAFCRALYWRTRSAPDIALPVGGLPRFLVTGGVFSVTEAFIVTGMEVFIVTGGGFFVTGLEGASALRRTFLAVANRRRSPSMAGQGWRDQCLVLQTMQRGASMPHYSAKPYAGAIFCPRRHQPSRLSNGFEVLICPIEKSTPVTAASRPISRWFLFVWRISEVPGAPSTVGTTYRAALSSAARTRTTATRFALNTKSLLTTMSVSIVPSSRCHPQP
jgi:hypothetical protein